MIIYLQIRLRATELMLYIYSDFYIYKFIHKSAVRPVLL